MQLAFEIDRPQRAIASFTYLCGSDRRLITHHIFATTFLGLGANSAYRYYVRGHSKSPFAADLVKNSTPDPCLGVNCLFVDGGHTRRGTGMQDLCFSRIIQAFERYFQQKQDAETYEHFRENYLNFSKSKSMTFYGLSEPFYSFYHFLRYQGPLLPSIYWPHSKDFCQLDCDTHKAKLLSGFYGTRDSKHLMLQCFKVPFIRFLLDKFLPSELSNPVINIDSHEGETIDWTYGAIVYILTQKPTL